jgi:hypothetical protein
MAIAASHDGDSIVGSGCDDQFEFEFALDLLLDGFERLRQQGWTSTKEAEGDVSTCPDSRCQSAAAMFVASRTADASAGAYSWFGIRAGRRCPGDRPGPIFRSTTTRRGRSLRPASGRTHRGSRVA